MVKKYITLIAFAAFLFGSCSDDDFGPVLQVGTAPAITAPSGGASFELKETEAAQSFANFTWTSADFGFQAGISYKLEMDIAGNNFADPVSLGVVNNLSLSNVTKGQVNNILIAKGLPGETPVTVELRIAATVNPDVAPVLSAPVSITITPYTVVVVYPQLQVPGSHQGWDPGNNSTVIFSVKSDSKFEGYIHFPDANTEFKYTDGPSWDVNWGDTGADGTLDANGDNIKAGDAGVYKLNVDKTALTHSFTKTAWGLIGSATPNGWDSDQDMTYDPATGKWSITLDLVAGEIKFRANDAWDINFGDDDANASLEYGGANIAIADAGNYTIELILNAAKYTYKVKKN